MSQKRPSALCRGLDALMNSSRRPATPVPIHGPLSGDASGVPTQTGGGPAASVGTVAGSSAAAPAPVATAPDAPIPLGSGEVLARLPLDLLQRGKYQPRTDMRQETLQEL